jgi:hypothetical protein
MLVRASKLKIPTLPPWLALPAAAALGLGRLATADTTPLGKALLGLPCTYILPEKPPETTDKPPYGFVVAPASVDDLFTKLAATPAAPAQ